MQRGISIIVMVIAIMTAGSSTAIAQPDDYEGPQGFTWIQTEPDCTGHPQDEYIGDGSRIGASDVFEIVVLPNPDPTWTNALGEVVTHFDVVFHPEEGPEVWVSNIDVEATRWTFVTDVCADEEEIFAGPFGDYLAEVEAAGEVHQYANDYDLGNYYWVNQVFTPLEDALTIQ